MMAAAVQDRREWEFKGVEIQDVDGIKFARHHVIPIDVFIDSDFLKDLQAAGWWSQGGSLESYKTHDLFLPWTIDGVQF